MQKLYSFITIILLVPCIGNKVWAQAGVGAMYIGDYSKMSSKDAMDKDMETGNWIYRLNNLKNIKYNFTVVMRDNSVKQVHSKIYADSIRNQSYLIDDSQQKIYCAQTKRISRINGSDALTGIATDSCWLFKVVSGQLNAYSQLSETAGINSFYIMDIQVGDGEIQRFTPELLESIINGDPKSKKAFVKKDYYKAIEKYNGR